jgi:hypothetical protein
MFCLTLDQPIFITKAILYGLAVALIIGFLLGVVVHYSFITVALIVGALIIAVVSTKSTTQMLKSVDYYFFRATT